MIAYARKPEDVAAANRAQAKARRSRRQNVADMVGGGTGNVSGVKPEHRPIRLDIGSGERSRPSPNENKQAQRQRARNQRILKGGDKNTNLNPKHGKPKPKGSGPHISHGPGAGSGQGGGSTGGSGGGGGGGGGGGPGRGNNRPGNTGRNNRPGNQRGGGQAQSTNALDDAISNLRSLDELRAEAAAEVNRAIADEVAPLQTELGDLGAAKGQDLSNINSMFGNILPAAQAGANAVQASYNQAVGASGSIMNQALDQLGELRQNRLAEGMALQTEVGGPIDVAAFTAPVDIEQQAFNQAAAGDMLNALGGAQAGAQEAQAFATQVLPLVQKEEIAGINFTYNRQMKDIRDEIARIKGQKGDRVNERLNELLTSEREYALQKTQADRDWAIAKATIKNEQVRLAIEKAQLFGVDKNGNVTLDAQALAAQTANDQKERKLKLKARAAAIIDKLRAGGTMTTTQEVPVDQTHPGAIPYPDGSGYYILKDIKKQVAPETDPNNVYDRLVIEGIPKNMARNQVIIAFGLSKKWKPHKIISMSNVPRASGGQNIVGGPSPGNTYGWTGQGPKPWWAV